MRKVIELSADNPKWSNSRGVSGSSRRLIPEPWKKKRSKLPWEKSKKN
jgi:hypothetical protein